MDWRRPRVGLLVGFQTGFTLLEVLIAVALMAMLGVILATSTSSLMGAIADTRETMDWYHTARVALGRMERELSMAYVSKHQGELRTTKTVFVGKSNSLLLTYMGHRRLTRNAAESDEGFVEYKLEKDNKTGETILVRREEPIVDDSPTKGGRREVLARGVKKLTFSYWDMDNDSWKSEWKVEIDNVLQEQMQKAQAAAGVTAATGNAALGKALASAQQERTHTAEDNWLPARVKIELVLQTSAGDLPFETQTRIRIQEPLDLSGIYVPKALENTPQSVMRRFRARPRPTSRCRAPWPTARRPESVGRSGPMNQHRPTSPKSPRA